MSFLEYREIGTSDSGKTKIWNIFSRSGVIGAIAWYGPWRKYCVEFGRNVVLDCGCLREVADFCETKTREHKSKS